MQERCCRVTALSSAYIFHRGCRSPWEVIPRARTFAAYHSHFTYQTYTQTYTIKYAVFPYPDCSGCSLTGKTPADMLTIIGSHEIRETVTDSLGNAWYDFFGYEADDKCAWHNLYQMVNGSFWVQPEYSNGGTVTASGFTATYPGPGCVVPK